MTVVIKPNFKIKAIDEQANYAKFILEPLDQGYGHTLGNALRRCLLGSLPGSAVTHIKIEGARHQFSTIPGLKEDVVELILNLKQLRISCPDTKEYKITLEIKGPKEVKASDIKVPAGVKIFNKDLYLANLVDKKAKLNCIMWVNSGYGYSLAEERKHEVLGVIPVDAAFTPIIKVNYKVEATRVGQRTDFDKLVLEIWTDGTIKPKLSLEAGAKILEGFFKQIHSPAAEEEKAPEVRTEDNEVLKLTVEELNLPTRIANALRRGGFDSVKDLTKAKQEEIAKVKNLGKKSIEIVIEKLKQKGVSISQ